MALIQISESRKKRFFMFQITLETANILYSLSNFILILGAILSLVGTVGSFYFSSIREFFSDERISDNEAITALAKKEAAEANERAAKANLELEKLKTPRTLSAQQQTSIIQKIKPFAGQKFSGLVANGVFDAVPLWRKLALTLSNAGWILQPPKGLSFGDPPAGVPINSEIGVSIIVDSENSEILKPAVFTLLEALRMEGIEAQAIRLTEENEKEYANEIIIEIGLKP